MPVAVITAAALALAGCGSDDDSASTATPAAAGSAGQVSSESTPATTDDGDGDGDSAAASASSGDAMSATVKDGKITVKATEFMFSPMDIEAKAGKLTITMENDGDAPHELVVLKTAEAADKLEVSNGRVDEKDSVGEIGETEGGKSGSHTFDLKAGHYVIVCNVPGHYMKGMRGTLTVS